MLRQRVCNLPQVRIESERPITEMPRHESFGPADTKYAAVACRCEAAVTAAGPQVRAGLSPGEGKKEKPK